VASRDKLSRAQQKAVDWINSKGATRMGAIGEEVGKMLAEICVELMDAKQEAAHWKAAFDTIQTEFKIAVGITLKKQGGDKLIITKADLATMPPNTELWLDDHEPGVRVYALRERQKRNPKADDAVRRIMLPH
jgi:hypothetical protein